MNDTLNIQARAVADKPLVKGVVFTAAFLLLYLTIQLYTHSVMMQNQEIAAMLVTLYVLVSVYTGSYITALSAPPSKSVSIWAYIVLIGSTTTGLVWLFWQAHWYASDRNSFNVLLFAFPLLLLGLSVGTLIKLICMGVAYQIQSAKAEAAHSQSELQLLQAQLSPHFLFNTLNNMYGISMLQPEKIPPLLLKLSDLLRYSVYDVKEAFVPLHSEIEYLRNYMDFEKIRIGEKLRLDTTLENVPHHLLIAPMLLIVFVENAFKHAKNTTDKEIKIEVILKAEGEQLLFSVKNSHWQPNADTTSKSKHSGLGLDNARRRLELLYPNTHALQIQNQPQVYSVLLRLNLK